MAHQYLNNSHGMILDGAAASQAVDSSGEVLEVEGCDISSLPVDGVVNYEHLGEDHVAAGKEHEKPAPGEEVVGRILVAKKIFDAGDCETEREELYWHKLKVPFVYMIARLADGAGHRGAQALAASIRDHHANNEPILLRWSIEGATLDRQGNRLKQSVARRVSITWKPCNRTAVSGLVEDPNAPPGFDKRPAEVQKHERLHPEFMKLGGAVEVEYTPFEKSEEGAELLLAKMRLLAKAKLLKTLAAGIGGAMPSALTQGAALQRESLRSRMHKAVQAYRPGGRFSKSEFVAIAKTYLPEANDEFLDHFADVAEDYHMRRLKKALDLSHDREVQPQEGLGWAEPDKKAAEPPKVKSWLKGAQPQVGGGKNRLHLDEHGNLTTPKGARLGFHAPSGPEYLSILHPDMHDIPEETRQLYKSTVHRPWERAMANWMELNKRAREGRLPRSVVRLAGLFSAMSPNTGVPLQERHFGHVMDMLHEGVMNLHEPVEQRHIDEFERRAQGPYLPNWNSDHYEVAGPPPGVASWDEAQARDAEPNEFGNEKAELPQIMGLRHLDDIMPHLEHLFATHGADGRQMASALMGMKTAYNRKATATNAAEAKAHFADKHPTVHGFGPKLTRYMLTMAGAGNMLVPDRHMTRSLWNIGADDPISDYLATQVVTKAKNEPMLQALDKHFFNKHPAVQYVLQKYPEHFKGHEEQAIFPAFWLHWLHIPHYERNQGREQAPSEGSEKGKFFMSGTDHKVFWDAVQDSMRRHGIPVHGEPYHYSPPDTSFDFGQNVAMAKAEPHNPWHNQPLEARALAAMTELHQRFGEMGALTGFFSHVAPALMAQERPRRPRDPYAVIRKAEALVVNLRKALADAKGALSPYAQPRTVWFAGTHVQPGYARTADEEYDLLHEDGDHFYAVPQGTPPGAYPEKLTKLPKAKWGTHYDVFARPSVLTTDLE